MDIAVFTVRNIDSESARLRPTRGSCLASCLMSLEVREKEVNRRQDANMPVSADPRGKVPLFPGLAPLSACLAADRKSNNTESPRQA